MPSEAAHPLASHRVPLVRHRTAPNLVLLKRLLDLLQVCQQPQVRGHFVRGCAQTREGLEDVDVDLAGVGLGRDGVCVWEPAEFSDARIERLDLLVVPVKKCQEGGLRARRSFDTAEPEVVMRTSEVTEVPEKLLGPEAGAFADRGQLSGLVVSETQRWK